MRVLYLTADYSNFFAAMYQGMLTSLSPYSELTFYHPVSGTWNNPSIPKLCSNDILEVISHIYGKEKPDVIMMWDPEGSGWAGNFAHLGKLDCLKVVWTVDTHNDAVPHVLKYIKDSGVNLILMSYDKDLNTQPARAFKNLGIPIEFYPFSVPIQLYKPLDIAKKYDVALLGNLSLSYYPLRNAFRKILLEESSVKYHDPKRDGMYYREDFVRHINESKISLTGSSSYNYPLPKYLEIMACNSLLMADVPMDADALHLVPNHNFVEVNVQNLMSKIHYYLEHEDERERIIHNARETILKYHTHEIRGKELLEIIKRHA